MKISSATIMALLLVVAGCSEPAGDPVASYHDVAIQSQVDLLSQLSPDTTLPMTVTFSQPLTMEEGRHFVEEYDLAVEVVYIYARDPDGTISTLIGMGHDALNAGAAEELLALNGAAFIGMGTVEGSARSGTVERMQEDQQVYLVDLNRVTGDEPYPDVALGLYKQSGFFETQ